MLLQDGAPYEAADDARDEARDEQNRVKLRLQVGHELVDVGVAVLGADGGQVRVGGEEEGQEVADDPAAEHAVRQNGARCVRIAARFPDEVGEKPEDEAGRDGEVPHAGDEHDDADEQAEYRYHPELAGAREVEHVRYSRDERYDSADRRHEDGDESQACHGEYDDEVDRREDAYVDEVFSRELPSRFGCGGGCVSGVFHMRILSRAALRPPCSLSS